MGVKEEEEDGPGRGAGMGGGVLPDGRNGDDAVVVETPPPPISMDAGVEYDPSRSNGESAV